MSFDSSNISIIICCKGEADGIEQILNSVRQYSDELIVVDGHSNDGTKEIVTKFGAAFYLDNKKGRGDALKIGVSKATKDILVFFDADGSHEASDIPALVAPIIAKEADLVIGSRTKGGCLDMHLDSIGQLVRIGGSYFMVYLVNKRFKTDLTELLYSFRAVKRSSAIKHNYQANNFAIEQDMVVRCLKAGDKVAEVPSREKARGWGVSKLKTSMGIKLLFMLVKDLYFIK